MEGYVIAAYDDDNSLVGYYTGASDITEKNLSRATFIADKGVARGGVSNLMRTNGSLDFRVIPVRLSIELANSSVS